MKVKIRYLGRTMQLFGLPEDRKEETIHLREKASYGDVLKKIKEKFLSADKNRDVKDYDIFDDIVVFSNGRILNTIKEKAIDHPEIIIAPLIAGG